MNIALTMLSLKLSGLKSYEKHLLTTLCIRADEKTFECFPSLKCLKVDTGLDEKTVQQGILSLIEKKLIERTGKMTGKTKRTPVYKIVFNTPANGGVQNLNTPVYPNNTPANGGVKYPRKRGMEGEGFKDIIKEVSAHAKSTQKAQNQKKHPPLTEEQKDLLRRYKHGIMYPKLQLEGINLQKAIALNKRNYNG